MSRNVVILGHVWWRFNVGMRILERTQAFIVTEQRDGITLCQRGNGKNDKGAQKS
jgi:hypothetical protein